MKKKTLLSLGAAGVLLASGLGVATAIAHEDGYRSGDHDDRHGGRHGGHGMFQRIDADASGGISLEEAEAAALERMARFDINGDGTVTQEEVRAHAAERFAMMDGDGNGQVTHEEARAAMKAWHDKKKEESAN